MIWDLTVFGIWNALFGILQRLGFYNVWDSTLLGILQCLGLYNGWDLKVIGIYNVWLRFDMFGLGFDDVKMFGLEFDKVWNF